MRRDKPLRLLHIYYTSAHGPLFFKATMHEVIFWIAWSMRVLRCTGYVRVLSLIVGPCPAFGLSGIFICTEDDIISFSFISILLISIFPLSSVLASLLKAAFEVKIAICNTSSTTTWNSSACQRWSSQRDCVKFTLPTSRFIYNSLESVFVIVPGLHVPVVQKRSKHIENSNRIWATYKYTH